MDENSPSMKVLLTRSLLQADRDYLRARLRADVRLVEPERFDEASIINGIPGSAVLLGGLLSESVLECAAAHAVRFIQIPWTGIDNLDFTVLARHRVTVCNSHSNSGIVAEHAVALMLASAKKIPYHDAGLRQGQWNRVTSKGNVVSPFSRTVAGTRAVIVGFGAIGQAIARCLSGFSVRIDVVTASGVARHDDASIDSVSSVDKLESVLRGADWVFLAAPLTPRSRCLIDAAALAAMGPDATLVNVSRGALVDESALYAALESGTILGAAVDTWYSYPTRDEPVRAPSQKHDFAGLSNVIMSPHRAGYAAGGFPHLDDVITNLNRAARGEAPLHVVSGEQGY